MRNVMVRIMATLVVAFVCLIAGMLSSTFANQGVRLSSEEMLSSNGAYAKVGKCTESCDRFNNQDQTCVGEGVADGTYCVTCSVTTNIDHTGTAGTVCPPGVKGNKTSDSLTQDCGVQLKGGCSKGVCVNNGNKNALQCNDPPVVLAQ